MGALASQITSLTIVYSVVYAGTDKKNIKTPRHWPLFGEFTGDRGIPRTKVQLRGKFDDIIMVAYALQIIKFGREKSPIF